MKIHGKVSDTAKRPSGGLVRKLEYKHAVDTIRLKNDHLSGVLFTLKTIFFKTIRISLHRSLKLVDDDIILQKYSGYILKFAQKSLPGSRVTESTWALAREGITGQVPKIRRK